MEKTSPQGKPEEKYCTYKVYDPDIQKIIYVGMTSDLQRRIKEHGHNSKWWKATLRFDAIKEGMGRPEAQEDEKHWIQYYEDRGHPLHNKQSKRDRLSDREEIMFWLGDDTETSDEEKEEIISIFLKGSDFVLEKSKQDMDWGYLPLWDRIHKAIWTVASELEKTHSIHLTHLDIARLTAKAVGMDIESEAKE